MPHKDNHRIMKKLAAVFVLLVLLSYSSFSKFEEDEKSIYTVISSTAYTAEKTGIYFGPEGLAFGLSDHTQSNVWGFLAYRDKQDISMGIGLGFKQRLVNETKGIPAIAFDVNYHTIVNPNQTATLPTLLQPYNIGIFNNFYSFGISASKQLSDEFFVHSAIKLYDYVLPGDLRYDVHLISVSMENRINEWLRDYAEVNYDHVNSVLNFGIKFDVAPTDDLRFSLGYMAGSGQGGLTASQFMAGAALHL